MANLSSGPGCNPHYCTTTGSTFAWRHVLHRHKVACGNRPAVGLRVVCLLLLSFTAVMQQHWHELVMSTCQPGTKTSRGYCTHALLCSCQDRRVAATFVRMQSQLMASYLFRSSQFQPTGTNANCLLSTWHEVCCKHRLCWKASV